MGDKLVTYYQNLYQLQTAYFETRSVVGRIILRGETCSALIL